MRAIWLGLLAFGPMLLEARLSRRHERALRAAGAVEPPGDVYRVMQIVYPAAFLAMIGEGWVRGADGPEAPIAGAAVFAAGKAVKYWAIATLGSRWTFRVLVPPGSHRTTRGPYRVLRHPNYVGVAAELAGIALMARAPYAGTAAVVGFSALLLIRIRVEERALG
ncbi:MAG TPA: isoprenylcysteine carboxylmethyltransferase family protein [Vicinamibacterales bacterium]|nr:isoprenylcysteine carboxylmethyltransferase family protein [Vicinamibacterales bacterium]